MVSMQLVPGYDGKEISLSGILYATKAIETGGPTPGGPSR